MNFPNPGEDVIAISERLGTISGFRFKEYEPKSANSFPSWIARMCAIS